MVYLATPMKLGPALALAPARPSVIMMSEGTMAQTYNKAGTTVGSHGPLSADEVASVAIKLKELVANNPDLEDIVWRFGAPPDYTVANYAFATGKTKAHAPGSLEMIVENLVKTWEMERSHKSDPTQHKTVDQERFSIGANGGKMFNNLEANEVGNYNLLLDTADKALYDAEATSWDDSHEMFGDAFAAFPWELLEVFSGPPTVAFTWRHWGTFTGSYTSPSGTKNAGKGELVELFGFGMATVNENLQLCECHFYYDANSFLEVLQGTKSAEESGAKTLVGPLAPAIGCPVQTFRGSIMDKFRGIVAPTRAPITQK